MRLGEEIVAAGLDRLHAVGRVVQRRDEDDRDARRARIALDPAAHLEAGAAVVASQIARGHRHVEDAEIRFVLEARDKRAGPVGRGDRAKSEHVELIEEKLDVRRDVVRDENERGVGRRLIQLHATLAFIRVERRIPC